MVNFKIYTQIDKVVSPYQFYQVNLIWTLTLKVCVIKNFWFPWKFPSFVLFIFQKFKKVFESNLCAENTGFDYADVSYEGQQLDV